MPASLVCLTHGLNRLNMKFLYILSCVATIQCLQIIPNNSVPIASSSYDLHNASSLAMSQVLESPSPYDFPVPGQDPAALFPMPDCNGITLEEATIDQLQDAMGKGQLTIVQIAMCYLQRISQTQGYIK